jgi:acyl carrier protein
MNMDIQSPTTDLLESGLLDSLGLVDLLAHMERQFGISLDIEDFEIDDFRSVTTIASLLATKLPKGPS